MDNYNFQNVPIKTNVKNYMKTEQLNSVQLKVLTNEDIKTIFNNRKEEHEPKDMVVRALTNAGTWITLKGLNDVDLHLDSTENYWRTKVKDYTKFCTYVTIQISYYKSKSKK